MVVGDFEQLLATVKALKEEAKLHRDDGEYPEAIEVLKEAVFLIDDSKWEEDLPESGEPADDYKKVAWNLADCLGMMGGNYRRLEQLENALACFERGRRYEEDPRLAVSSSYNLVNAITLPVEQRAKSALDQKEAIERAIAALERQVRGGRRVDRWAWADLGECRLLLGEGNGAKEAYDRFVEIGDADSIQSAVSKLRKLRQALSELGDTTEAVIGQGIQYLEKEV